MSGNAAGFLGFAAVLVLIFAGVPVAVSMAVVGVAGLALLAPWSVVAFVLGSVPYDAVSPYTLSVVPLFILMGVLAARGGLSRELYQAVNALIGHWRGGLAMATVGACAAFGGICGSSLATAATMCRVALPEMRANRYDDRLACAVIAAGGTLGILIPPSIIMSIYGLLTETSIGKLSSPPCCPACWRRRSTWARCAGSSHSARRTRRRARASPGGRASRHCSRSGRWRCSSSS